MTSVIVKYCVNIAAMKLKWITLLVTWTFSILCHGSTYQILHAGDGITFKYKQGHESLVNLIDYNDLKEIDRHINATISSHVPVEVFSQFKKNHLYIYLENNTAMEGVFYPPHTHPSTKTQDFIISLNPSVLFSKDRLRLITHEVFHALHYIINPVEESWVREGLAQLFEYKIHRNYHVNNVMHALTRSTTELMGEFNIYQESPERYGHTFLYFLYLNNKCDPLGKNELLWKLAGAGGIDAVLSSVDSDLALCQSFKSSADSFMLARTLNRYSGFEQKDEYYILDHISEMAINDHFEKEFQKLSSHARLKFIADLPPYLPLVISTVGFKQLFTQTLKNSFIDEKIKIYFLQATPPYLVRELSPSSLPSGPLGHGKIVIFKSI